ncbi:unnamed protein product [Moneuplotes crassus]|uniref:Uncharacterized protein n=1 Tax=Euplotes crassus TaxID=5936 RepID=A0AAD1YA37_EUPCR|nr:unnamed protein product [Moneuplotes crassus]
MEKTASRNDVSFLVDELATKASTSEVIEMNKQLCEIPLKFVKIDSMLELNAKVENIKEDLEERAKVDYVKNQVESLSNELKEVISDLATRDSVSQTITIIESKIKKVKRDLKNELDRLYEFNERIEQIKENSKSFIQKGQFDARTKMINNRLKKIDDCCKFQDLQDHANQIEPLVTQCRRSLEEYRADNKRQKDIIARFDEVLLEKASKFSVEQLEIKLEDYSLKTDLSDLMNQLNIKTNENKNYIKEVQYLTNNKLDKSHRDFKQRINDMEKALRVRTQEFLDKNTIKPDEV